MICLRNRQKAEAARTQEKGDRYERRWERETENQSTQQQGPRHPPREGFPTASERSLLKSWVNVHRQHSLSHVPGPGCHPCKKEVLYPFHR